MTADAAMPAVDAAPAATDVPHRHRCWRCRDDWWHETGDEGCVGVRERDCPMCEDSDEALPERRPWWTGRAR